MKKIKVNKDACIGCGMCQSICEEVFQIGDDGFAEVIVDEIPENLEEEVMDALESCPTEAIVDNDEK